MPGTHLTASYAATIGFFDGVHLGHRFLVQQLCQYADERGFRPLVITFDRHPRQVLQQGWHPLLLTSPEEKVRLLQQMGGVQVVVLPFTPEMAALSARDFMHDVLLRQLGVRLLLTGYDNHFGRRTADSSEGYADYVAYGQEMGIEVVCGKPLAAPLLPHSSVSSSLVRRLLGEGRIAEANACLGRPYQLEGTVVEGEQMGRQIGFPTANLRLACADRLVPASGVYAVRVKGVACGSPLPGMTNIGTRPTFDGHRQTIETHILDYSGDLYGAPLTIELLERLRDEQHFDSAASLARQMALDAEAARKVINNITPVMKR